MSDYWDNVEILRAIDQWQQETYRGGPLQGVSGLSLMHRMTGSYAVDRMRGFIQELHISYACGLLTFTVRRNPRPNAADADPNSYLQDLSDFALTVEGQDRARGRMIARPEPEPGEDDGRPISDLILRQVATAITDQYAPDEIAELLQEEGIPPEHMQLAEYTTERTVHAVLAAVWRWGSIGRRAVRRFLGRWLDNQLLTGPGADLRGQLLDQLARQGWRVRADDSMLVTAEPARGIPISAPFLRSTRLHALIEAEARDQFLNNKPDLGVLASMRAIEVRVRKLAGYGDEMIGVAMMNAAFGPGGPLTDSAAPKGEQEATRSMFAGAYGMLRNPTGRRVVTQWYFYCYDRCAGPFFLKYCGYFPYQRQAVLQRQRVRQADGRARRDRLHCAGQRVRRLRRRGRGAADLRFLRRAGDRSARRPVAGHPADHAAGYRYEISVVQAEFSSPRSSTRR